MDTLRVPQTTLQILDGSMAGAGRGMTCVGHTWMVWKSVFFFGLEKKYTEKVIFKREIDIEIVVCFIGTCLLNVLGNQQ